MFAKFTKAMKDTGKRLKDTGNVVKSQASGVSEADKKKRHESYKGAKNERYLHIETVFKGSEYKGMTVLVFGGSHGVGPSLVKELSDNNAFVITTSSESKNLKFPPGVQVIHGVDKTEEAGSDFEKITKALQGRVLDVAIVNEPLVKPKPNPITCGVGIERAHKLLDSYAIAPLNIISTLVSAGALKKDSKVVNINSQDSSITWRKTQGEVPFDYSYHMARCAANMAIELLSMELKDMGIIVVSLHPGFNKTELTEDNEDKYEDEGAVSPSVGAKRILHEITRTNKKKSGKFLNVEDGLRIPW